MLYRVKLKNCDKNVLLDDATYEFLQTNPYLVSIDFVNNLRIHSRGYAFFQKNWPLKEGGYRNETIYLHKLIAEKFIPKPESESRLYVSFNNGDRLDCRLENLEWAPLSKVVRKTTKSDNKLGYRGVIQEGKRFRAIIHYNKQKINLGTYPTIEEAAEAYNKKSEELFGKTLSLNKLDKADE